MNWPHSNQRKPHNTTTMWKHRDNKVLKRDKPKETLVYVKLQLIFLVSSNQIIRAEQINASTPLIKTPTAFPRTALSPIPGRNTAIRSTGAKTPALKKRVAFDVVDSPDCVSLKTPLYRATPYLSRLGLSTPSGVIHPPLFNDKRTMSVSNPEDFVSPKEHLRYSSDRIPRNKRLPDDALITPSGFMKGTVADASCEESLTFTPSLKTRSHTPPQVRQRLSEVDHSVSLWYSFLFPEQLALL